MFTPWPEWFWEEASRQNMQCLYFPLMQNHLCVVNRFRTLVGIYSEPRDVWHCFSRLTVMTPKLFGAELHVMALCNEGFTPATEADLMQMERARLAKPPFACVLKLCCRLRYVFVFKCYPGIFSLCFFFSPFFFLKKYISESSVFSCWQCHRHPKSEVRLWVWGKKHICFLNSYYMLASKLDTFLTHLILKTSFRGRYGLFLLHRWGNWGQCGGMTCRKPEAGSSQELSFHFPLVNFQGPGASALSKQSSFFRPFSVSEYLCIALSDLLLMRKRWAVVVFLYLMLLSQMFLQVYWDAWCMPVVCSLLVGALSGASTLAKVK